MDDAGLDTANKSTSLWEGIQRSGVVARERHGGWGGFLHEDRHLSMFRVDGNKPREKEESVM